MKANNAVVLITGANRGIGSAFVKEFLKAGAKKIYLGIRRQETIAALPEDKSQKLVPLLLDVTNSDHIRMASYKAKDVTILVNNAGVLHKGNLLDAHRMNDALHEMKVNYFGTLEMTRAFAPILKVNGGGAIINMSSIAGLVPMPHMPTYSTSKAAVHFLTLETRMELFLQGTAVVGVYPDLVDTDMAATAATHKIKPARVALETIRGLEAGETHIFPDPFLKDIYAVLHNRSEYIADIAKTTEPLTAQAA